MYRQLQQKAKEYIIEYLCGISESWKFDIDTTNADIPIIVGHGPDDLVIRAPIGELYRYITEEFTHNMAVKCRTSDNYLIPNAGFVVIHRVFRSIFCIYGINILFAGWLDIKFSVINKNDIKIIHGKLQHPRIGKIVYPNGGIYFMTPYNYSDDWEVIVNEQFVDPLLLLLDPILFFGKYSSIIQKHPELDRSHTWGIYEMLLGYFPEMNDDVFVGYLAVRYVFQDICADIIVVIMEILIELYV